MGDTLATAYSDPRLTLVRVHPPYTTPLAKDPRSNDVSHHCPWQIVDDAAKFISQEGHDTYDAIVVDSSDPVGTSHRALVGPSLLRVSYHLFSDSHTN